MAEYLRITIDEIHFTNLDTTDAPSDTNDITANLIASKIKPIVVFDNSDFNPSEDTFSQANKDATAAATDNTEYTVGEVPFFSATSSTDQGYTSFFGDKDYGYIKTAGNTTQYAFPYVIQFCNNGHEDIVVTEELNLVLCLNFVGRYSGAAYEAAQQDSYIYLGKILIAQGLTTLGNTATPGTAIWGAGQSVYIGFVDQYSPGHHSLQEYEDAGQLINTCSAGTTGRVGLNLLASESPSVMGDTIVDTFWYSIMSNYNNLGTFRPLTSSRLELFMNGDTIDQVGSTDKHWDPNAFQPNPNTTYYDYSIFQAPFGTSDQVNGGPRGILNFNNHAALQGGASLQRANATHASGNAGESWITAKNAYTIRAHSWLETCGDPHINTLSGLNYDFRYEGFMRYYEGEDIIINVECTKGDEKWANQEYFRKMYLNYKNKELIIDLGFRGTPVTVLKNDGFNINERSLEIVSNANRFCGTCNGWKSSDEINCNRHMKKYGHNVGELVRNSISLKIGNYNNNIIKLYIENVNKYNLQPCKIKMKLEDLYEQSNAGLAVGAEWVSYALLKSLNDTTRIAVLNTNSV